MKPLFDGDIFEVDGLRFRVNFEHDQDAGYPWDESEGHGPVRQSRYAHGSSIRPSTDKRPGERPLNRPDRNEYQFYYDWQAACRLAKADGWNAEPYDAPGRVLRAVQADFDFLAAYVNDDWQYVGVIVQQVDGDDSPIGEREALWGVETWKDYHFEAAHELAGGLARQYKRETSERRYWAERDVQTVGAS